MRDLDGAYLEHALDESAAAMRQRSMSPTNTVSATSSICCATVEADAAVLIRPTGIDEIRRTADERLLMPPKSTFFTPKLRTGLVLRPLDCVTVRRL